MAKGSRSKIRKFWASERRKTLGVPAEKKQLEEQSARLKASINQQQNAESILKLKSVLNPWGVKREEDTASMDLQPPAAVGKETKGGKGRKATEEVDKDAPAVKMDVDKVVHRPVAQKSKGKKKAKGAAKKV